MLSTHDRRAGGIVIALLLATIILVASAWSRGTEYDEDYSVFLAAGVPRPVWPAGVFSPSDVQHLFAGHSTMGSIATDLRRTDVHPPLYFWTVAAWRGVVGTGLFETRLLSVLYSVAALLGVAKLARLCGVPPVASVLITIGCYGFAYTGSIARGFALAQLCVIWGTVLTLLAVRQEHAVAGPAARPAARPRDVAIACAGGVVLGLASFTNYLAAFGGVGALCWLLLTQWRRYPVWLAAGIGFAAILPLDLYFFAAQRGSRTGQFPPFHLLPSLGRLGKYTAANIFGGLPLYVGHAGGIVLGGLLVLGMAGLLALVALRWRRIGIGRARLLLAMAALATPVGLLLLGFVFNNTPIELRYVAFAMPFLALLVAGSLASLPPPAGYRVLIALLCLQALSLLGMMTRPETMQPQAQTARAAAGLERPGALVLVPYGNDGVGVLAAFVREAPASMRLLSVALNTDPAALRRRAGPASRVILVLLGLDGDSKATLPQMLRAFRGVPCWTQGPTGFDTIAFDRSRAC
ncbi:hypothetical protein [Lichenicoccus sp.]|uniref:hypothetical protein n=1 Tax=Lichenicoccus sp. TaxID=2781899 RepID=UPI003D1395ED